MPTAVLTTPTTEDHTPSPQENQSDHVTTSTEECVQDRPETTHPETEKDESENTNPTTPPPDETPVEDADLSFSVSPTTPLPHSKSCLGESSTRATAVSNTNRISKPKIPTYTKQSTLTGLFAPRPQPTEEPTAPAPSLPEVKPQLSSMDEFLLEKDEALTVELEPKRVLTPLEKFQQRFTQHATSSQPKVEVEAKSKGEEKTSLVPKELVNKLVGKPGW